MVELDEATEIILKKCLDAKDHEKVLVLTDEQNKDIGEAMLLKSAEMCKEAKLVEIPIAAVNGAEPSDEIAEEMLKHDVILMPTSMSLSHTMARKNASENGARIGSMPGVTKDILSRAIDVDYGKLIALTNKICDMLDSAKKVKVVTEAGTEIEFDVEGRKAHGRKAGIYKNKGEWGNLPCGEAFIAPVEGNTDGVYVVDGTLGGIGAVDAPVRVKVEDGYAVSVEGKDSASTFKKNLEYTKFDDAYAIAEFGIGTNENAEISGRTLEDEKVLGTCHIALGNNIGFGGANDVPFHVDGVIKAPTIFIDGKKIMDKGKLLIKKT